ncbi:MAG: hypothetical protein U1F43_02655 [Myxococcota bacterium]
MNVGRQLLHGLVLAPLAPRKMRARSWGRAALYALLATLFLGAIAAVFATEETSLRRVLESFFFPEGVHKVVDFFIEYVVRSQTKQVVANGLVTITMLLVSLFLFWAKERLSQAYEEDAGLGSHADWNELSAPRELFEEVKLFVLNLALLVLTFWIGHGAEPWRKSVATVFSYLTLFFTWAVDFGSPYLQRRGLRYWQIIVAIFKRPILSFGFGAVVSLPLALVANLVGASDWSALATIAILFGSNVVVIVWASVAGTWMGAKLYDAAHPVRSAPLWLSTIGWVGVLTIVGVGAFVGANVAEMLRDKSQILKCEYAIDWKTLEVGTPSVANLIRAELAVGVSVEMGITNPNDLDVTIEKNRLVASDGGVVVAESHLSPVSVPAGRTVRQRVALDVVVKGKSLLQGASVNPLAWDLTLYVEVAPGYEFPIYLRAAK